jgi:hypothetical protein
MCDEVTMCRVHLRLCSAIVLSSIPLSTLDLEIKVEILIDVEVVRVEIVLDHVWVEPEDRWLDAWVEMNRHRQLFESMLLVCSDLSDGGSRSQITEIEFWEEGDGGNARDIQGWVRNPWPLQKLLAGGIIKSPRSHLPAGGGL